MRQRFHKPSNIDNVSVKIVGDLGNDEALKGVLLNNVTNGKLDNLPCGTNGKTISVYVKPRLLDISLTDSVGLSGTNLLSSSLGSFDNCLVLVTYREFNPETIQAEIDNLKLTMGNDTTICLVGLEQAPEYEESELKGVDEAERFAKEKGWHHQTLPLNSPNTLAKFIDILGIKIKSLLNIKEDDEDTYDSVKRSLEKDFKSEHPIIPKGPS